MRLDTAHSRDTFAIMFLAEETIRVGLEKLQGKASITEMCRRERINPNLYYCWNKDFLEAGKKVYIVKRIELRVPKIKKRII